MSKRRKSKYKSKALFITSTITQIEEKNVIYKSKYKNVFTLESKTIPEGRKCILWGQNDIRVGDTVIVEGRITLEDVFIATYLKILKRSENETPSRQNVHN